MTSLTVIYTEYIIIIKTNLATYIVIVRSLLPRSYLYLRATITEELPLPKSYRYLRATVT